MASLSFCLAGGSPQCAQDGRHCRWQTRHRSCKAVCSTIAGSPELQDESEKQNWQSNVRCRLPPAASATAATAAFSATTHPRPHAHAPPKCRTLQGRRQHRLWEPCLADPPPLLDNVAVVLVSPKRPISVGTVARSCAAFECEDLRIVAPRAAEGSCQPLFVEEGGSGSE